MKTRFMARRTMISQRPFLVVVLACAGAASLAGQTLAPPPPPPPLPQYPLHRTYHEGETLAYQMTGQNEAWHYTIRAYGIVTKGRSKAGSAGNSGPFVEEYRWSGMESDGKPLTLSPETLAYRQTVSL